MKTVTVLLLASLLLACATVGNESLTNRGDDWPPLTLTKAELLKELGPPNTSTLSVTDGKSTEVLTWVYAHVESNPALFIPIVGLFVAASGEGMSGSSRSLAVIFDTNGKLVSRSVSQNRIGGEQRKTYESMLNW